MNSNFSFKTYFDKIFSTLVLILGITLTLIGVGCFIFISRNSFETYCKEQQLKLIDMENSVNSKIKAIQSDVLDAAVFNNSSTELSSYEEKYHTISDSLTAIMRKNDLVTSAYYYDRFVGYVINSSLGIYPAEEFYDMDWDSMLDYKPRLYYLPLRKNLNSDYTATPFYLEHYSPESVFTIVYGSIYSSSYVVNISVSKLYEAIGNIFPYDGTSKKVIIYDSTTEAPAESSDKIVLNGTLAYGNLNYSVIIRKSDIIHGYLRYVALFLCLIFFAIITLSVLAWVLSRKFYKPVDSIFNTVSLNLFLEGSINSDAMQNSYTVLHDMSYYNLIVLRQTQSDTELPQMHFFSSGDYPVSQLQGNMIGILISGENKGALITKQELVTGELRNSFPDQYLIVKGDIYTDLSSVRKDYKEILETIDRCDFFEITNRIIEKRKQNDSFTLPLINYETDFITAILSNDTESMDRLTDELFLALESTSEAFVRSSCQTIFVSLDKELKLASKLGIDIKTAPATFASLREYRTFLRSLLENAGKLYTAGEGVEENYCREAKDYMENNYTRDIDMLQIADALHISYPYLSKIFKSTMGTTLSDYLNEFRVEKSCELLTTTDMTLNDIAAAIGYNNSQSYQRFFKKYKNLTPTEYRKLKEV